MRGTVSVANGWGGVVTGKGDVVVAGVDADTGVVAFAVSDDGGLYGGIPEACFDSSSRAHAPRSIRVKIANVRFMRRDYKTPEPSPRVSFPQRHRPGPPASAPAT